MGIAFAYLFSLPAALHFLASFGQDKIQPLISANDYLNFVIVYLLSFAIIFQLPVIVSFINTIKPLTPRGMMSGQRYIIAGSAIIAAAITPTPDPLNQIIMAAPVVVLYQLSIVYVWYVRRPNAKQVLPLNLYIPEFDDDDTELEAVVPAYTLAAAPTASMPAARAAVRHPASIDGVHTRPSWPPKLDYERRPMPATRPGRIISDFIAAPRPLTARTGRGAS